MTNMEAIRRFMLSKPYYFDEVAQYVSQYGTAYEQMIKSALDFLNKNESEWGVTINRDLYISLIIFASQLASSAKI